MTKKKQSKSKSSYDPAFHGDKSDLMVDPANDGTKPYVDGAGCFGGEPDRDNPVYKLRMIFLENPGEQFAAKDLCMKMSMKWQQLQKPLLMARQQGIVKKIKRGGLTFYEGGRSL